MRRLTLIPLLAAIATSPACPSGAGGERSEVRIDGDALGTSYSVAVVAPSQLFEGEVRKVVEATLDRVDRQMSTWRSDAELARFNNRKKRKKRKKGEKREKGGPFTFSPETRLVIAESIRIARETGGAFDPTVRPLVRLWGFGADAESDAPDAAAITAARGRVGWKKLRWAQDGAALDAPSGTELDLSAIAKGYAADAVVRDLMAVARPPHGVMVEVGGEVRVVGPSAAGRPWRLGIELPAADPRSPEQIVQQVIELTAGALATSGDYRQVIERGGERISHVIDPRTGRPADTKVASASVIAPTCAEADAVATALMVMGADAAIAWIEARPWLEAALLIRDDAGGFEQRASSGWPTKQDD